MRGAAFAATTARPAAAFSMGRATPAAMRSAAAFMWAAASAVVVIVTRLGQRAGAAEQREGERRRHHTLHHRPYSFLEFRLDRRAPRRRERFVFRRGQGADIEAQTARTRLNRT
jgi:hypothetical protein